MPSGVVRFSAEADTVSASVSDWLAAGVSVEDSHGMGVLVCLSIPQAVKESAIEARRRMTRMWVRMAFIIIPLYKMI